MSTHLSGGGRRKEGIEKYGLKVKMEMRVMGIAEWETVQRNRRGKQTGKKMAPNGIREL